MEEDFNPENYEKYEYLGFVNCKSCGLPQYDIILECFVVEMMEILQGELPPKELEDFLKKVYNPNVRFQDFEINGKKVMFIF